jgi:hypothetical protein
MGPIDDGLKLNRQDPHMDKRGLNSILLNTKVKVKSP